MFGILLQKVLPAAQLNADAKDVIKQAMALLATMSALVLGLLIASAKTSYDTRNQEVVALSSNIILVDWLLNHYGPEAGNARAQLRQAVAANIERIWPTDGSQIAMMQATGSPAQLLYAEIEGLSPATDAQRQLKARALQMVFELGQTRVLQTGRIGGAIPIAFVIVLTSWLCLIFAGFGLFAPPNPTVIAVLVVCAFSASTALFMIMELDRSFDGFLRVSSAPLRAVLANLPP